ncbi:hypothetical protein D3C72_1298860 [compost metagenome]
MRFSWAAALASKVLNTSGTKRVLVLSTRRIRVLWPGSTARGNQKLRTCTGRWEKAKWSPDSWACTRPSGVR